MDGDYEMPRLYRLLLFFDSLSKPLGTKVLKLMKERKKSTKIKLHMPPLNHQAPTHNRFTILESRPKL